MHARLSLPIRCLFFFLLCLATRVPQATATTVDFEDLTFPQGETSVDGFFGGGTFTSRGMTFDHPGDPNYRGFAYSKQTDITTADYTNAYSAYSGSGAGGSANYAVSFGYLDLAINNVQDFAFNPNNLAHLQQLSHFNIPTGQKISSMLVNNSTYPALSMRDSDTFGKKFGGVSGNDADWFKLTVFGTTSSNQILTPVDFYLADFRFANNAQDYIISQWTSVNLSSLANATTLYFNLSSSDVGANGMNTPGYFAIDNIQLTAAPEPGTFALLFTGLAGGALWQRRRKRSL